MNMALSIQREAGETEPELEHTFEVKYPYLLYLSYLPHLSGVFPHPQNAVLEYH